MPSLETSAAFFVAAILLGLAPGPDIIFIMTQSALYGAKAGIATTFGLCTGLCFQTIAVAAGVAALLRTSPAAFLFLKLAGAAYLCWLAWLSFRSQPEKTGEGSGNFPGCGRLYGRGIIMNITNPKVLLFSLAFLPQFCVPGAGPFWAQILYFGALFIIATFTVFCPVSCVAGKLASWFNKSAKAQILMHRVAGCIFLGLALALALVEQ